MSTNETSRKRRQLPMSPVSVTPLPSPPISPILAHSVQQQHHQPHYHHQQLLHRQFHQRKVHHPPVHHQHGYRHHRHGYHRHRRGHQFSTVGKFNRPGVSSGCANDHSISDSVVSSGSLNDQFFPAGSHREGVS